MFCARSLKALVNEDTLLPMMFLELRKLGNIFCRHKMFLNKFTDIFLCAGHKICVRNKCCARGQTGKHLCRQQCALVCQSLNNVKGLRGLRNANYEGYKVFAFPCGIERPYCIFGLSTFLNSQDPDNRPFSKMAAENSNKQN